MTTKANMVMLPSSPDAEVAVLGSILFDNAAFACVAENLEPGDFYNEANRVLFEAMQAVSDSGRPIDATTLTDELVRTNKLEVVGGVEYLASLTAGLPRSVNTQFYAAIVKKKAVLRELAHYAEAIHHQAEEGAEDPGAILERAFELLRFIDERRETAGPVHLGEFFKREYRSLDDFMSKGQRKPGITTGFRAFDGLTCGLHPGDLIYLAARPSMGKTAWALSATTHVACDLGRPVLFFSLEMGKESILERLACALGHIDSHRFRGGVLNKDESTRFSGAMARILKAPIHVDDAAGLRLVQVQSRARRLHKERRLGLIVIDYLQLMTPPRAENRNQELSVLSRQLKALARELQVPMLVVSQLSRATETRQENRPRLSDLRDSGSLEQDADIVGLLYRAEYYLRMEGKEVPADVRDGAEMIIAKHRNGATGDVPLVFMARFANFGNWNGNGRGPDGH